MSPQADYVVSNGTGAAVRSDINGQLAAIVSQNSGATAPATTYAYMTWADTTAGVMKMRNGANNAWITLYQLDGEWSTIAFENGSAAAPSIYFKDSGTDTGIYSPGTDQVGITTGGTVRLTTTTTGITSALPVDVPLGAAATPSITFTGDTNTGIYSPGADQVAVSTGGTARITVDASGNVNIDSNTVYVDAANNRVGIGTSAPGGLLEVKSADQNPNLYRLYNAYNAGASSWGVDFYRDTDSGSNLSVAEIKAVRTGGNASELKFGTSSTPGTVVERVRIDSSGNFKFDSGYGSAATAYGCRAWVNFNGTGTVAIRGSGNVSSITDNGTGDYTVNFTTALADANYAGVIAFGQDSGSGGNGLFASRINSRATTTFQVLCGRPDTGALADASDSNIAIFR